ncbi:helix-turn-helix domain-containing protein [Sphingomonas yabuuchiae]|uniref:helix-turn-helix domain-containing protein n=1 Tax=Sphingomonas yabuuchiae TaxID=172044 RepID=UPI003D99FD6D
MTLSINQCRAARALLDWTITDLAQAASVGVMTVKRFEAGQSVSAVSIQALSDAFYKAGISFVTAGEVSTGGGEGVRFTEA